MLKLKLTCVLLAATCVVIAQAKETSNGQDKHEVVCKLGGDSSSARQLNSIESYLTKSTESSASSIKDSVSKINEGDSKAPDESLQSEGRAIYLNAVTPQKPYVVKPSVAMYPPLNYQSQQYPVNYGYKQQQQLQLAPTSSYKLPIKEAKSSYPIAGGYGLAPAYGRARPTDYGPQPPYGLQPQQHMPAYKTAQFYGVVQLKNPKIELLKKKHLSYKNKFHGVPHKTLIYFDEAERVGKLANVPAYQPDIFVRGVTKDKIIKKHRRGEPRYEDETVNTVEDKDDKQREQHREQKQTEGVNREEAPKHDSESKQDNDGKQAEEQAQQQPQQQNDEQGQHHEQSPEQKGKSNQDSESKPDDKQEEQRQEQKQSGEPGKELEQHQEQQQEQKQSGEPNQGQEQHQEQGQQQNGKSNLDSAGKPDDDDNQEEQRQEQKQSGEPGKELEQHQEQQQEQKQSGEPNQGQEQHQEQGQQQNGKSNLDSAGKPDDDDNQDDGESQHEEQQQQEDWLWQHQEQEEQQQQDEERNHDSDSQSDKEDREDKQDEALDHEQSQHQEQGERPEQHQEQEQQQEQDNEPREKDKPKEDDDRDQDAPSGAAASLDSINMASGLLKDDDEPNALDVASTKHDKDDYDDEAGVDAAVPASEVEIDGAEVSSSSNTGASPKPGPDKLSFKLGSKPSRNVGSMRSDTPLSSLLKKANFLGGRPLFGRKPAVSKSPAKIGAAIEESEIEAEQDAKAFAVATAEADAGADVDGDVTDTKDFVGIANGLGRKADKVSGNKVRVGPIEANGGFVDGQDADVTQASVKVNSDVATPDETDKSIDVEVIQ